MLLTLVYLRFGLSWATLFWSALTALLIVISFIDLDTMEIPTGLVVGGAVLATAYNAYSGNPPINWLLGGALGFGLFYLIYWLSRGGMGGGDVRLAGLLGLALGWRQLLTALLLAFTLGALVSLLLLAARKLGRKDAVPFGPFLAIGSYVAALWGEQLVDWYLRLFL
jgi:leader peptidase (prepilin peptidase)/N-methyltransferase